MSNHNYNKYYNNYKKPEEQQTSVVEPEQTIPETPETPTVTTAPETVTPEVLETTTQTETVNGVVFNCVKLNVREKPVAGSRVVSIIDVDTELAVTTDESFGIFYKVCTSSGIEGYCVKDYVRLV